MTVAGFLALAVLVTAPAAFDLDGRIIGSVDAPALGGEMLVQAHAVEKSRAGDVRGFFRSDLILDPRGHDFAPSIGIPLHLSVVPVLRAVLGPYGVYNAVLLLLLVTNGVVACWFLTRRGVTWPLALVGGAALMLSPYFLIKVHLGFPVKLVFFWSLLYTDALLTLRRTCATRTAVIAAGLLVGALTAYPQYVLYLGIVSAVFVAYDLATRRMTRGLAMGYGLVAALFVPAAAAFGWFVAAPDEMTHVMGVRELLEMPCVDAGRFWRFFPMERAPAVHRALPMAVSPVLLVLFAVGVWRAARGEQRLLALCAAALGVCALGPFLQMGGEPVRVIGRLVPLPFYLLDASLPSDFRVGYPLRAFPIAWMCLLPVALLGLQSLFDIRRSRTTIALGVALLGLLLVESRVTVPELYRDVTAPAWEPAYVAELRDGHDGVLHLPMRHDAPAGREALLPPHRYSLVTALTGRPQANPLRPDPAVDEWLMTDVALRPGTGDEFLSQWFELLADQGVTTLAVHRQYLTTSQTTPLDRSLARGLGEPFVDGEERVDLYALPGGSGDRQEGGEP